MPSDEDLLDDIRRHAEEAVAMLQGVSLAAFRRDRLRQLAIERLLGIVGEASRQLSQTARDKIPHDWDGLRGLRNVLAHQYGEVEPDQLHRIVKTRLAHLVKAIQDVH